MDPTVLNYLENIRTQREDVENWLKDRENKRRESNEIFLSSVKKELEWLEKNKTKYELRNQKFLEEAKGIVEDYKAELAKAYQADQALNVSKKKLDKFIQKNYPKIVSQLKARLFQDHDEVSRKLRNMREGGSEMVRLNTEIRHLSEEIQAKRYELLEEEERRLRKEGALRNYMYYNNPYAKPYDASLVSKGDRNLFSQDVSRGREDIKASPEKRRDTSQEGNDQRRLSAISRDSEKNKNKAVSFGGVQSFTTNKVGDNNKPKPQQQQKYDEDFDDDFEEDLDDF